MIGCHRASFAVLTLAAAVTGCTTYNDSPTGVIERKYAAMGPAASALTVTTTQQHCDHRHNACDLYYPTNLAAGAPHPIITWGNGTGGVSKGAEYFIKHLASWGFVVVATRDRFTGDGTTILDAANFMVAANRTSPIRPAVAPVSVRGPSVDR